MEKKAISPITAQIIEYPFKSLFGCQFFVNKNEKVLHMGIINRAIRNISRRKIRALLVIIALGFSMAIMISIPAGVLANQQTATNMANNLSNTINQTSQSINATATQIDCSIASSFSGFGFSGGSGGNGGSFTPGQFGQGSSGGTSGGSGGFGGFGGGGRRRHFGGGAFSMGQGSPMNESLYTDINSISGVAAVEPTLQVSEGQQSNNFEVWADHSHVGDQLLH